MKIGFVFSLLCPFVLLMNSCSDSGKISGGSIEDENAISENQINEWYSFGIDVKASALTKIDGGELAVLDNGSGARAECSADSSAMAMTIQISNLNAISTLEASGFGNSCDSIFTTFKAHCSDTPNSEFYSISKGCKNGAFDAACRMRKINADSINTLISDFNTDVGNRCFEMSKNAKHSTGSSEIASSASKNSTSSSSSQANQASTGNESSSSTDVEAFPSDTTCCNTSIKENQTLKNYILQFTTNTNILSFDKHVIAYNSSPKFECIEATGFTSIDLVTSSTFVQIDASTIQQCFPMTAKIMNESATAQGENCRYFITSSTEGGEPTGIVLSSISDGAIEFTSVVPGGNCLINDALFTAYFLIEDCDEKIKSTEPQVTRKTFKSETWKCEEGSTSPTPAAVTHGERFNETLR